MISNRPVQFFSDEYLNQVKLLSDSDRVRFLEDIRALAAAKEDVSKLISVRVSESLLSAFKVKCRASGLRYQSQIKELMKSWLLLNEIK